LIVGIPIGTVLAIQTVFDVKFSTLMMSISRDIMSNPLDGQHPMWIVFFSVLFPLYLIVFLMLVLPMIIRVKHRVD